MSLSRIPKVLGSTFMLALALSLGSCTPRPTPAFFMAPTESPHASLTGVRPPTAAPPPASTEGATSGANLTQASPTPPCKSGLTYVQDLSVPDGSNFAPGQSIDKRWQVRNSGTCNWDRRYGLKLISGDAMGNPPLLPLFPARAGADAVLEIRFTAPPSGGLYECHWQAVDPQGQPFGDAVYMQISVAP